MTCQEGRSHRSIYGWVARQSATAASGTSRSEAAKSESVLVSEPDAESWFANQPVADDAMPGVLT
jgi:hypothetical protein